MSIAVESDRQQEEGVKYQKLLTPTMQRLPKRLQFGEIKKRFRGAVSPSMQLLSPVQGKSKFSFAANELDDSVSDIYSVIKIEENRGNDGSQLDESLITTSDDSLLYVRRQDDESEYAPH